MPNTIRMVCLANSRKNGEHCIAGINLNTGEWFRPVNDGGEKLEQGDIEYKDGKIPKFLDIINVPVLEKQPLYYQPENWIINPKYYWFKDDVYSVSKLIKYCDKRPYLFGDNSDRLTVREIKCMRGLHSLVLIKVKDISLEKKWPFSGKKPQIRAKFQYNRSSYDLVVTDISLEERFIGREVDMGSYFFKGNFLLTISLGELFKENHYKLVASLIYTNDTYTKILDIIP